MSFLVFLSYKVTEFRKNHLLGFWEMWEVEHFHGSVCILITEKYYHIQYISVSSRGSNFKTTTLEPQYQPILRGTVSVIP